MMSCSSRDKKPVGADQQGQGRHDWELHHLFGLKVMPSAGSSRLISILHISCIPCRWHGRMVPKCSGCSSVFKGQKRVAEEMTLTVETAGGRQQVM